MLFRTPIPISAVPGFSLYTDKKIGYSSAIVDSDLAIILNVLFEIVYLFLSSGSPQHFTNAPVGEEKAHGTLSMATYYHYFRAGGNFLVLIIVLVVFLMGEVCVGEEGGGGGVEG